MALRTEENYNSEDFASFMVYLHWRFGVDVFRKPARMYGLFLDLAPNLKGYANITRQVIERGLLAELEQAAHNSDRHGQARVILKTQNFLENELLLGADRVSYFLTVFGTLYGVTPPNVAQSAPRTPDSPQRVPRNPQAAPRTSDNPQSVPRNPQAAPRQAPPMSGRSGLLTWKLNNAGRLTISGHGDMDDFTRQSYHQSNAPWCAQQSALTEVVIENGVAGIGNEAFCDCANLKRVTIPDTVTHIGYMAFRGCPKLKSVTIPSSVITIELSAFEGCTGLTNVKIQHGVVRIQGYAFTECRSLTGITIPYSVRHIGYRAFWGCENLNRIYVPKDTSLDADAFGFQTEVIRW